MRSAGRAAPLTVPTGSTRASLKSAVDSLSVPVDLCGPAAAGAASAASTAAASIIGRRTLLNSVMHFISMKPAIV